MEEDDDDDDGANTDADGGGGGGVVVVVDGDDDDDDDDDPAACGEAKEKDSLRKAGGGVEGPVAGAGAAAVVAGCLCWAGVPGVEAATAVVTDSNETAAAAGCAAGAPPPADGDGDRVRLGDVTPLAADCSIYGLWRHRRLRKMCDSRWTHQIEEMVDHTSRERVASVVRAFVERGCWSCPPPFAFCLFFDL